MTEGNALIPRLTNSMAPKSKGLTQSVLFATLVACLGSVQFGYHTAELNAPQQVLSCSEFRIPSEDFPYERTWLGSHNFKQCIPLDDEQIGVVTAMFCVGGVVGSYYAGLLANLYGRKRVSFFTSLLGCFGSLVLFCSNSYAGLIMGRILVGLSSGVSIVVIPLFINEITPVAWKGAMGSMNQVCINLGILLTQTLALKFADSYRWRWLMFAGSVVAILNFFLWFQIKESPKWLTIQGKIPEAEISMYKLRGGTYQDAKDEVQKLQRDLQDDQDQEGQKDGPTFWEYVKDSSYMKPRNVITMILMGQQLCGINSIVFYGVKVISQLLPDHAIQINFAISILNLIMTFVASLVIDHLGRKPLLMTSTSIMTLASLLISFGIKSTMATLLVVATLLYIAAFAIGLGPIPFLIIGELSSPQDAATAQSYGTVCNWIGTAIVAYAFPIVHDMIGGYVYTIFAAVSLGFTIYVYQRVPETKSMSSYAEVWSGY